MLLKFDKEVHQYILAFRVPFRLAHTGALAPLEHIPPTQDYSMDFEKIGIRSSNEQDSDRIVNILQIP
ncbi:uncharacterized protein LACBIDRAFT_311212 [Laccaria bicolor S238N-H82]|uniref:Predicted protein n=1 Tax=Laccaria bicolor (strain S238N-H82 / ATCC MYA-4686) TaxID=486041 RepID=B0CZG7_LACBS|nr:uncharacterized protein LACBIDRAFT_311212 [Laccaria bicolor S238N-H82]EDR12619.1 predicted protein [Laccaria bicolor S238N-H82]|eukprot:XP_001876883.1 predicted protein [Laccaria bicolor S238N-H82]